MRGRKWLHRVEVKGLCFIDSTWNARELSMAPKGRADQMLRSTVRDRNRRPGRERAFDIYIYSFPAAALEILLPLTGPSGHLGSRG